MKNSLLRHYPNSQTIADYWLAATGTTLDWQNITRQNLRTFTDHLCDNLARSSARQYCARLKAVILQDAPDNLTLPRDWKKCLAVKDDESQQVYLTEDEVQRLAAYPPATRNEAIVLQQFLLGCLTGARHSDYQRFTEANITDNGFLTYVSQKTHVKAELPLAPLARRILQGEIFPYPLAYKESVCDNTFNATIRRICWKVRINSHIQLYRAGQFWKGSKYEAVSSHTARRTFATCLYLRCRDIVLVSRLCGHSSTTMTERYICCTTENLTQQALQYFNHFQ